MSLLFGCANTTLKERWKKTLGGEYRLEEGTSPAAVAARLAGGGVELLLLHRSLVDLDFLANLKGVAWLVLADIPDDREAIQCYRAGALGYVNAYIAEGRLREVVRVALAGQVWIGQNLMAKIIRGTTGGLGEVEREVAAPAGVSPREWEVALLVARGSSNLEIAATLAVTERTVKAHIGSLFQKTGTNSRLQLALLVKEQLAGQA